MRKRIIILIPVFFAVLVFLFLLDFFVLASPAQVEQQLRRQFEQQLGSRVTFGEIHRGFLSTRVTVTDVHLASIEGNRAEFMRADEMEIRLNPFAFFKGPLVKQIRFVNPSFTLVRDKETGWNFPLAAREPADHPVLSLMRPPSPTPLPTIDLSNADFHIKDSTDSGKEVSFFGLNLAIEMGGLEGERSLTVSYYYGSSPNEGRRLQLTFSMPQDGNALTVRTSTTGNNYLLLTSDFKKLLQHLSDSKIAFAKSILDAWNALKAEGSIRVESFRLECLGSPLEERQWRVKGDFFLENCSIEYPYKDRDGVVRPITVDWISGNLKLDGDSVNLNLRARALKNSLESITGSIERPQQPDARVNVEIVMPSPDFNAELKALLPPEETEKLNEVELKKGARLVLKLRKEPEEPEVKLESEMAFKDGAATFAPFPYPLEGMNGVMKIKRGLVEIVGLTARHGDGTISVSGQISQGERGAEYDLFIQADNLPLDEALHDALPASLREIWDRYAFRPANSDSNVGHADITLRLKAEGNIITPDCTLTIHRGKGWLAFFPYLVTDVEATILVSGENATKVELVSISGRHGGAEVSVRSGIANYDKVRVDIQAKNVQMERALGEALQGNFREAYDHLNPAGTVDFKVRVRQDSQGAEVRVEADVISEKTLSLTYDRLPLPIKAIATEFTITPNEIILKKFAGTVGGANIEMQPENKGVCRFAESADASFFIKKIEGMELNKQNVAALPEGIRKTLSALMVQGKIDIEDLNLAFHVNGERADYNISLRLVCRDLSLGQKGNIKALNGALDLSVKDKGDGKVSVAGTLNGFTLTAFGLKVGGLNGEIASVEPKNGNAKNSNPHMLSFAAALHGPANKSNLVGKLVFELGAGSEYNGDVTLMGAEINSVLADLGEKTNANGKLSGHLTFNGKGEDISRMEGEGWMRFIDANLVELPLVLALKSLLKGSVAAQVVNRGKIDFKIRNSALLLERIILKSDALTIAGHGTMNFDGDVDLNLYSDTVLDKIPVVDDLMRLINKQIYAVSVKGKFMRPEIGPASFADRVTGIPKDMLDMLKDLPNIDVGSDED